MFYPSRASFPPPLPANDSAAPVRWLVGHQRALSYAGSQRRGWRDEALNVLMPFGLLFLLLWGTGFRG
jgi:hypothetical protein